MSKRSKEEARQRRHHALRKRIGGSSERPRLSVFRSARHIYAQVVDDLTHKTLAAASDLAEKTEGEATAAKKRERAKRVGAVLAKTCLEKGIHKVVFDRGGYKYHGRISALAEGARAGGLKF